ncbi:MAG: hypothetical protein AB1571_03935 [Nanoarchaeota archaeon]
MDNSSDVKGTISIFGLIPSDDEGIISIDNIVKEAVGVIHNNFLERYCILLENCTLVPHASKIRKSLIDKLMVLDKEYKIINYDIVYYPNPKDLFDYITFKKKENPKILFIILDSLSRIKNKHKSICNEYRSMCYRIDVDECLEF